MKICLLKYKHRKTKNKKTSLFGIAYLLLGIYVKSWICRCENPKMGCSGAIRGKESHQVKIISIVSSNRFSLCAVCNQPNMCCCSKVYYLCFISFHLRTFQTLSSPFEHLTLYSFGRNYQFFSTLNCQLLFRMCNKKTTVCCYFNLVVNT